MKFAMDSRTKELLNDIASAFGVKPDIVRTVWEFTIFTWLLKYKDSVTDKIDTLIIGSEITSFDGMHASLSTIYCYAATPPTCSFDCFISVNEEFKDLIHKVMNDDYSELSQYVKNTYIDKLIEDNKG